MQVVDHLSSCSHALRVVRGDLDLGHATGFLWLHRGVLSLLTNWHVVTGRNPSTLRAVDRTTAAEPDALLIRHWDARGVERVRRVPLLAAGVPAWRVHPEFGRGMDVVCIPLARPGSLRRAALNERVVGDVGIHVGAPLFILGFPFAPERYPIWKLATVASEPALTPSLRRHLLVDTASRPGMSGSPVVRRRMDRPVGGTGTVETSFVGVYSGRLDTRNPMDAQLGMVWPARLVHEIVECGRVDDAPHDWRPS